MNLHIERKESMKRKKVWMMLLSMTCAVSTTFGMPGIAHADDTAFGIIDDSGTMTSTVSEEDNGSTLLSTATTTDSTQTGQERAIHFTQTDKTKGTVHVMTDAEDGQTADLIVDSKAVDSAPSIKTGDTIYLTVDAADGYDGHADKLSVTFMDGEEKKTVALTPTTEKDPVQNAYKFTMPEADVSISADGSDVFTKKVVSYPIQVSNFQNCTASVTNADHASVTASEVGKTVNVLVNPSEGYVLNGDISIRKADGSNLTVTSSAADNGGKLYSFTMPDSSVTIDGTGIAQITHQRLNVSGTTNGIVTINGTEKNGSSDVLTYGDTVTAVVQPLLGYEIKNVTAVTAGGKTVRSADGKTIGEAGSGNAFVFTMPADTVTITAEFEEAKNVSSTNRLTVSAFDAKQGTLKVNGTESNDRTVYVSKGSTVTLKPSANAGYRIGGIEVATSSDFQSGKLDVAANADGTYTFQMPQTDTAVFVRPSFVEDNSRSTTSISVDQTMENGTIRISVKEADGNRNVDLKPGTTYSLPYGSEITITAMPDAGYKFRSLSVNGEDQKANQPLITLSQDKYANGLSILAKFDEVPEDKSRNPLTIEGLSENVADGDGTHTVTMGSAVVNDIRKEDGTTTDYYQAGSTVRFRVYPENDWCLPEVTLTDLSGNTINTGDEKDPKPLAAEKTAQTSTYTDYSFVMPEMPVKVKVNFTKKQAVVVKAGGGKITVNGLTANPDSNGNLTFAGIIPGTEVTVNVSDDADHSHLYREMSFAGISGAESIKDKSYTFTMPKNEVNVTASFDDVQQVSVKTDGTGKGNLSYEVLAKGETQWKKVDALKVKAGDKVRITAVPSDGSFFGNLTVAVSGTSDDKNPFTAEKKDNTISFTVPEQSMSVNGVFNRSQTAEVTATKEVIDAYGSDFTGKDEEVEGGVSYKSVPVVGAQYKLIADEDFYENGNLVKAGTELETLTTDKTGKAISTSKFTGKAHLTEAKLPSDETSKSKPVELSFVDGYASASYDYPADTCSIRITADDDAQNGQKVNLIAATDISIAGGTTIKKGDIVASTTLIKNKASFHMLPDTRYGRYAVQIVPADGTFAENSTILVPEGKDVTASADGFDVKVITEHQKTTIGVTDPDGKQVSGAKMEILNSSGRTVASFTSGNDAYSIERLVPGDYTLHTVNTAPGYISAGKPDVEFTIGSNDQTKDVSITEKQNEATFSVTDKEDGAVTKGAVLNLFRIDGDSRTLVGTFGDAGDLSAQETIKGLPAGMYCLVEKTTPQGYQKAADSSIFVVDETTPSYTMTISSERTYGVLDLTVLSQVNRDPVSGAVYALYKDGKAIVTLETGTDGKATTSANKEKWVPIGDYADGIFQGSYNYQLQEIKAPKGYVKSEKTYDIKFAYLNDTISPVKISATLPNTVSGGETQKTVAVKKTGTTTFGTGNSGTNGSSTILSKNGKGGTAQTGDTNTAAVYGSLAAAAAVSALAASKKKKKKKN